MLVHCLLQIVPHISFIQISTLPDCRLLPITLTSPWLQVAIGSVGEVLGSMIGEVESVGGDESLGEEVGTCTEGVDVEIVG